MLLLINVTITITWLSLIIINNNTDDSAFQSVTAMQTAVRLRTVQSLASVPAKLEPQGGAVTPAFLDTPGEEAEPDAQVSSAVMEKPELSEPLNQYKQLC